MSKKCPKHPYTGWKCVAIKGKHVRHYEYPDVKMHEAMIDSGSPYTENGHGFMVYTWSTLGLGPVGGPFEYDDVNPDPNPV